MARNIVHTGGPDDVMPWTNGTGGTVTSGSMVVMANTIGVALVTIPNGGTGSVAVGGVVSGVPKLAGAAWAQGAKLVWDVLPTPGFGTVAQVTPASGDVTGAAIAWLAAASADTTGVVKLTPGNTAIQ